MRRHGLRRHGLRRCRAGAPRRAAAAVLVLVAAGLGAGACARSGESSTAPGLVVERESFEERFLLTGELEAAEADVISLTQAPTWQVQIRWMEDDGAVVEAGQTVVELDNSSFVSDLEDKRLRVVEAESALRQAEAQAAEVIADGEADVGKKQAELDRARLKAEVPPELLPAREVQERELALRRAELELEKSEAQLAATEKTQAADLEVREIELAKARREVEVAEEAIEALSLEAPAAGVLVVEEHPWEGRKLQIGDTVWVGFPIITLPDLETLQVTAVLSDVDEGRIRPGMRVRATPDAFPELELQGRVLEVAPVAREVEGSSLLRFFRVAVGLDGVDPERLRPGMSVRVEVFGEPLEDVLVAPREALDLAADPPRAWLAAGGQAEVRLGPCNPSHCVVEAGVEEGEGLARRPPPATVAETAVAALRRLPDGERGS